MKHLIVSIIVLLSSSFFSLSYAQIRFSGSLPAYFYIWENPEIGEQWDYYQGFQFRITPEKYSNIYLKTYLRLARRGNPVNWQERLYNSFVNWKSNNRQIQFRIGRQFVFHGVINGTVDALLISISPLKNLNIKVLGGFDAPYDRKFKIQNWDSGNVLGGYSSYRFSNFIKIDLSYFQKSKDKKTVWQQMGTVLSGKLSDNLHYYSRLDFNLKNSEYQIMRLRLTYSKVKWTIWGEYNNQRPRVYEDSYFRIFDIKAFNQVRSGVTYQLGDYQLGLQLLHTIYEEENTNEALITASSKWGVVGLIYQNGYGGENTGLYGEIRYAILYNLTFRLYSSYYDYRRHTTEISEEAISFSAGLDYKPFKSVQLSGEIQESNNSYYKNDLRGLLKVNYLFNFSL